VFVFEPIMRQRWEEVMQHFPLRDFNIPLFQLRDSRFQYYDSLARRRKEAFCGTNYFISTTYGEKNTDGGDSEKGGDLYFIPYLPNLANY